MNIDNKSGFPSSDKWSKEDAGKLISENHSLKLQLKEANELLEIKEEELVLLRQQQARGIEMKSLKDAQELELQTLKQRIKEEIQKATGAGKREKEMEAELEDTLGIYAAYSNLQQQYTLTNIELDDSLKLIEELKERNLQLQHIANRVAILESELKLMLEEKDAKQTD